MNNEQEIQEILFNTILKQQGDPKMAEAVELPKDRDEETRRVTKRIQQEAVREFATWLDRNFVLRVMSGDRENKACKRFAEQYLKDKE